MEITTYGDLLRDGIVIMLHDDQRYVKGFFPDEWQIRFSRDEVERLKLEYIQELCNKWQELFGEQWVVQPRKEGMTWTFIRDDAIEGEVCPEELLPKTATHSLMPTDTITRALTASGDQQHISLQKRS